MSTSTTLASIQLRLRDHLLQCSSLMCLRKKDISLKTKEHSGSGHAKGCFYLRLFVPFMRPSGSIDKTPFTSKSFLICEFALFPISGTRFRTSGKRRKSSSSLRFSFSPCVPPKTGHALHAPLSLCVIRNSVRLLSLLRTTSALQLVFGALLVVGWLCSERAVKINTRGEDHSQVSLKFTHENVLLHQVPSELQCHLETALPME